MTQITKDLADAFAEWQTEDGKFEGGNAAAGTRARKALQDLATLTKARRKEITEVKAARKEAKG
jgi:hypothetical protein